MKYVIYNVKRKKALKYKDVYAYQELKEDYVKYKIWNKVIVFEFPIQAKNFIDKYLRAENKEYNTKGIGGKDGKTKKVSGKV